MTARLPNGARKCAVGEHVRSREGGGLVLTLGPIHHNLEPVTDETVRRSVPEEHDVASIRRNLLGDRPGIKEAAGRVPRSNASYRLWDGIGVVLKNPADSPLRHLQDATIRATTRRFCQRHDCKDAQKRQYPDYSSMHGHDQLSFWV